MNRLQLDLDHVLQHTAPLWRDVSCKTIFITGGTGFFGKWLLNTFIHINTEQGLKNKAIVLTRNKQKFLSTFSEFERDDISFIEGDVSNFNFPEGKIDYIIHAATDADMNLNIDQPLLMYDTIVNGTKRVLELAREKKVISVLLTSSGAVYGDQPQNITHVSEEFMGAPHTLAANSSYGEGKRVAEMLAGIYYRQFNVPSKVARCYAFAGPYLPLDGTFAFGNFLQNVIDAKEIIIKGDGTPRRSYLYAADLAIWLWSILFKGTNNRVYNVGSDEDVSIKDLADAFAGLSSRNINVTVEGTAVPGQNIKRYVPSIARAKEELNLHVYINLKEAIQRTVSFYNYQFKSVL